MAVKKVNNDYKTHVQSQIDWLMLPVNNLEGDSDHSGEIEELKAIQSKYLLGDILPSDSEPQRIFYDAYDGEYQPDGDNYLEDYLDGESFLDGESWLYQNKVYQVTGKSSNHEQKLLVMESAAKERQKFERLKTRFNAADTAKLKYDRQRIPEEVRVYVWRRDQGKCAQCESRENLEYEHIVPVSRGGSNTARNVELLCQVCNRAKGDRIQ